MHFRSLLEGLHGERFQLTQGSTRKMDLFGYLTLNAGNESTTGKRSDNKILVVSGVGCVALSHGIWTSGGVTVTLCPDLIGATCCKCHISMSGSGNKKLPGEDHG